MKLIRLTAQELHVAPRWLAAVALAPALVLAGLLLAIQWPVPAPTFAAVRAAYIPSDAWLLDRHGEVLDSRRINLGVRRLQWASLAEISPALLTALIQGEDRRFWQHRGIDWLSVLGALRDEIVRHQRRGASTITMQLATLLSGSHHATGFAGLLAKVRQMQLALALERHWSKRQILEAYLNLLEYRGEMQGIRAASYVLAGRPPSALTWPESLALAALLPEPQATAARVTARACARARAARVATGCDAIRAATSVLFAAAGRIPAEHLVPQLAQRLLHRPGEELKTTLDAHLQRLALQVMRTDLTALAQRNVRDGALLVVDNATGEVLAYVGSGGPLSRSPDVDGVQGLRQAGSTLKPFLYELALERRYLTASSLLADSPLSLETASGLYIPQDYDHDFKGLVSVRTALASSLNVPAVRTLVLVGVEAFRNRLNALGYTSIKESGGYYGYSLALGSAEVSLWEQAQAYRALARGGAWSPLTLTPAPRTRSVRRMAAAASFVVSDILSDPAARVLTFGMDSHLQTPFWSAVKTGTSEDMRDNWCIGYSSQYTVAVWVGNFEGDSMRDVSGVSGAAPIWHDMMSALQQGTGSTEPRAPPGVISRLTRFSPAVEPPRREWYLSPAPAIPVKVSAHVPAPASRAVTVAVADTLARIQTPANGMIIALDPDIPPRFQRVLISVRGASPHLSLTLNGRRLGPARAQQLWTPRAGVYRLSLDDGSGHSLDRVLFTVRGGWR